MTETQELIAALRDETGDPYFQLTGGVAEWLKTNWALREKAASALEHLVAERDAAVAAEREACAQIADARKPLYDKAGQLVCSEISSSIRARNAGSGEQL